MKKSFFILSSILIGLLNGLFGSGGGIVAIKVLEKNNIRNKYAHASSLYVILPISILSVIIYFLKTKIIIFEVIFYCVFGMIGSFIGSYILKGIDAKLLKKIFSLFMIYSGFRILLQ